LTEKDSVVNGIKKYPTENDILVPLIGKNVDGTLDSGGHFFGTLEGFSDYQIFLKGDRGQRIIIKRRKIARMEVV
jgi:hypothetical protein